MARLNTLHLLLLHVACAFGDMYEAFTIEPASFVGNTTEQTTHFMCLLNAGRNGQNAFRIRNDTGECEMGSIIANATQSPSGINVYVKYSFPSEMENLTGAASRGRKLRNRSIWALMASIVYRRPRLQ